MDLAPATAPRPGGLEATVRVARLPLLIWRSLVGWPWGVLAVSFVINYAVMASVDQGPERSFNTGGLLALYVTVFSLAISSMTQWFPFAVGLSVTRTRFYLAASLLTGAQAVVFGTVLLALRGIEQATGGWGVDLAFFGIPFLVHDNAGLQLLIYVVPLLTLSFLGMVWGLVFTRWGQQGVLASGVVVMVAVGALVVFVSWRRLWPAVVDWFVTQSPAALFAGWPLLATVALAATGLVLARRAVP